MCRRLALAFIGLSVVAEALAHDRPIPSNSAPPPLDTPILTAVLENADAQIFSSLVRTSELDWNELGFANVSFLAPKDAGCADAERDHLLGLDSKREAQAYVLGHAFKGQLTIQPEDGESRMRTAYYFPDAGTVEVMRGRVSIDEAHPFAMPLLSGQTVLISISGGTVHVGGRSTVLHNNNGAIGGDEFELDKCALF